MKRDIRFTVGNWEEHYQQMEDLCKTWHEDRKYVKEYNAAFNPDREYFHLLNRTGNLVFVCAFDGDLLVATYVGYRTTSMHDVALVHCNVSLWCIRKEYRDSELLVAFLAFLERVMKESGIDIYSLCLDDLPEYSSTGKYLEHEINPLPFKKIESYYYRDIRGD